MTSTYFKMYLSVNDLPEQWDALVKHDIFLQTPFLRALESTSPINITPFYIAIFNSKELIGVAIIQRVEFYLEDAFRKTSNNKLKKAAKAIVAKLIRGNALVVGNLMHTGQHGLFHNKDLITTPVFLAEVFKAVDLLTAEIKKKHHKSVRIIAFKDFFDADSVYSFEAIFEQNNLYKVQFQPNMILSLDSKWLTINDYVSNLKKKYKRRFKTARKKKGNIVSEELTLTRIEVEAKNLHALYKNVSDNAKVNAFVLQKDHFYSLKQNLRENFRIFGYYLEGELVGFYSLILNGESLETYFLGYNRMLQINHQIYLNMLYDMLTFAVENKFKTVIYARTAMEIKSSVGATPQSMSIYMKHTNGLVMNPMLKLIARFLNPSKDWKERHPFKS